MAIQLFTTSAFAFDDDRSISEVDLKSETFLDLNAHAFRRATDYDWAGVENGFRMAGGSTSTNTLFFYGELRLKKSLSDHLALSLRSDYEEFYADKPVERPLLSIEAYPIEDLDVGVSMLGTVALDKRQADLGYAFTFGREPNRYVRFSWLRVDVYHNEKNDLDDSVYEENGETISIEGHWPINDRLEFTFDLKKDRPLILVSESESSRFEHEGYDYEVSLYFTQPLGSLWGGKIRRFEIDKSLAEASSDVGQKLRYQMLDIFHVKTLDNSDELSFGLRYDFFKNDLADANDDRESFDFKLNTTQIYADWHHQYSTHQSWDLGVYTGWSSLKRTYVQEGPFFKEKEDGIESKFRGTWEYHSIDGQSALGLSFTLNLDDLFNDPGDGGGMYFRMVF